MRISDLGAAALLAAGLACPALGQGTPAGSQTADTTGTNPAVLSRTLAFSNEYRFLPEDRYYNVALLRYTEPFLDGRMALRLTLPFDATNLGGGSASGLGDASLKLSWIPYVSPRQAIVLSAEIYAPTAAEDALGTGRWVAAPGITWAWFASSELIVAPALIHNASFGDADGRAGVSRTDFDFYLVYRPHGRRWWITSDVTVSYDDKANRTPASWELAFGRNLAVLRGGAALNGYIRPGIGIGRDRPYDANIEIGISLVNF